MKKMKKALIFLITIFVLLFIGFELFFVLPYPWYKGENIKLSSVKRNRYINYDIIKNLSDEYFKNDYADNRRIRKDYYKKGYNISLGKFLWLLETRRGVPAKYPISFEYTPAKDSVLSFAIGVDNKSSEFKIRIDGKTVFNRKLVPAPDKKSSFFNKFLKVFYFKLFPQKGYWKDYKIPLKQWADKKIKIEMNGDNGFWANPIITEKRGEKFSHPNVILIQIDALRADFVKNGYLKFINKIKNNGAFFNNAYSNANWTRASNYVQFYAKRNSELGLSTIDFYLHPMEKRFFYQNRFISLPLFFEEKGYRTAAIVDNVFIHGFTDWGVDIGFQQIMDFEKMKHEAVYITDETLKWINKNSEQPFFLFLDYNVTHFPYHPPVKYINLKEFVKAPDFALYKACARYTDDYIKKLINALDKGGYLENTIIIINADHGETFYNAGKEKLDWNLEPVKVKAHGYSLWSEEVRVPIVFYWKKRIKHINSYNKISIIDIPKTVVNLAGFNPPEDWDGENISNYLLGKTDDFKENPIIIEGRNEIGIIDGDYKYITGFDNRRIENLFNIRKDSLDRINILDKNKGKAKELRRKIYELYPSYYPVLVIDYNLGEKNGEIEFESLNELKFYGGDKKVNIKEKRMIVNGEGSLYFVFKKFPADIKFKGGIVKAGEEQINLSENILMTDIFINKQSIPLLLNPYNQKLRKTKGFWIYITDVLSFVSLEKTNNNNGAGEEMKQLLIDWGYVKQ
jgi:arylsulfatase A-like enzyme